jgi:hypothetical protein
MVGESMSEPLYHQIYRCRKCGKEFCPTTVYGLAAALCDMNNLMMRANGAHATDYKKFAPLLYMTHRCVNGDIGVGDFIGYQKEEQ